MPTAPTSSSEFTDLLNKSGLLSSEKLASLSDLGLPADPQKAAAMLVAQGIITRFQAQQLLSGRHKGFRIGGYLIQDMLGRGGMGAVYLAEHLELHRKVAIKVLVPGRDEDQKLALERFIREARAAAALDHPNIVRIFDVARHNDVPYLVMEYVEGETLQQVLDRDGAVPYPAATEYIAQAAAGLQHAHEKGFIHRDIKPGNLMRDKSGTVKILDMGLARSANGTDNLTERLDHGAVVGTADFIAPEQALNQPNIDCRADIYSLGATFFALIIGKPPFEGNTTQKLLQHQLRSAPRIAALDATLPKGLSAVVAKMLAKKPEDRYQSPAEVIAALAPWMGNSSRILAGISRTKLAQGADLQATLSEIGRGGSSRRLHAAGEDSDEVEVDRADSEHDTGAVASAKTTRARRPQSRSTGDAKKDQQKRILIYSAVAVGVSILGVLGAWAAFGGSKKPVEEPSVDSRPAPEKEKDKEQPRPVPPKVEPKPNPPKIAPKGTEPKEISAYKFNPADVEPFRVVLNGGMTVEGKKGVLPRGVAVYALKDGEAEFAVGKVEGTSALSITRRTPSGDTHAAFELERDPSAQGMGLKLKPDTDYKIRVNYRTGGAAQIGVSIHTLSYRGGAYRVFPATGGKWSTIELPFHHGKDPMRLTISATGGTPGVPVSIGSVEIVEVVPVRDANGEKIISQLKLQGQRPFSILSGLKVDPKDPNRKEYRPISRTGEGDPPAGWTARPWHKDSEMEFSAAQVNGSTVLGIRTVRGPGSAMLFMPRFECPTAACRVRFEYSTNVRANQFVLRFKSSDNRPAWDVLRPPVTNGAWRAENLECDLRGATGGFFEFHNNDNTTDSYLRVRAVTVTELKGSGEEAELFKLDAEALPEFRNTKLGRAITSGDEDPKIKGVYFGGWKNESISEWVCGTVAGYRALGYTNINEVNSAQVGIELESATGLGLRFEPGQRIRLRIEYRTSGKGRGRAYFQTIGDHKVPDSVALPSSNTDWTTVDLITVRGDRPLRCVIDTNEVGPGNTLFLRAATISEAGKGSPLPRPAQTSAPDLTGWTEGKVIYALDVTRIPEFRVVKEHNTRTSGEAEKLPVGVGCMCWKTGGVGEFRCERVDGVSVLSITNLNDEKSAQFHFELEKQMKLQFQAGKWYRVRLSYATRNDAAGVSYVQVTPGYSSIGTAQLPNTAGQWRTATASFMRPPTSDNVELRMVVDNTAVGEGNALLFRSLEIVELNPPKK